MTVQVTVITFKKLYNVIVSEKCVLCHVSVVVHVSVTATGQEEGAGHVVFIGRALLCGIGGTVDFEMLSRLASEVLGGHVELVFCAVK